MATEGVWIAAVSMICAAVAAACAIVQVIYARKANRVALRIANDQAAEAIRARREAVEAKREAVRTYIESVLGIGETALEFTVRSMDNLPAGAPIGPSHSIPSNWRLRVIEYQYALDALRGASPPDARLLVAVARLTRVLEIPVQLPEGPYPVEQILKRVQGSLSIELAAIRGLAVDAGYGPLRGVGTPAS
jgi:hypothetical protein